MAGNTPIQLYYVHRCRRKMDILPTCSICGTEAETSFHAMIICTKARALRQKMREEWDLPPENNLRFTGDDWAIVLLSQVDARMRAKPLVSLVENLALMK
jgi:hypothetical protein